MGGSKKTRKKSRKDSSSDERDASLQESKKKKKRRRESRSSSSDSSSSDSSHHKKHKRDRQEKKEKKKLKKLKKKLKKLESQRSDSSAEKSELFVGVPSVTGNATASRPMVPMTKEEWEKQQSVIRREFDPTTGRSRLVRGSGEIVEEIVSKERQKQINKAATAGDGIYYQKQTGLL